MFLLGFFFEFFYYIRIFQNGKENKQLLESIDRDKGHSIITFALRGGGGVHQNVNICECSHVNFFN